jgi:hypothetical protein
MTSTIDSASVSCMSCTLARSVEVRSERTEISIAGGIQRLISGISSRILSTVSMTLASALLMMVSSTAGLLLNIAAERALRVPPSTLATSERRTAVPLATLTMMFL